MKRNKKGQQEGNSQKLLIPKYDVVFQALFGVKGIEIHIIEMPKVLKYKEETEKGLSMWIEFLLNPESELVKMRAKEDKKLKVAYEKLEYISGDAKLRRIAELRRKYILDQNTLRAERQIYREKYLEEGQKVGEQNEKEKITRKLLKLEMPIEQIVQITELTEEEIRKLKEQ